MSDSAGEMMKLKAVTTHAESVNILGWGGDGLVEEDILRSTLKDTEYIQLHSPASSMFNLCLISPCILEECSNTRSSSCCLRTSVETPAGNLINKSVDEPVRKHWEEHQLMSMVIGSPANMKVIICS